jgi:peptide/nickel transport system permease protein
LRPPNGQGSSSAAGQPREVNEDRPAARHGLRSALTPVVTQFGIDLGALLGGAIVTETVFSLPGLGKAVLDAINQQNDPVIVGIILVGSAAIVAANIFVDIACAVLDPRVRLQ